MVSQHVQELRVSPSPLFPSGLSSPCMWEFISCSVARPELGRPDERASALNMFSTVEGKAHSKRKRMMSNVYSKSHIQSSPIMRAVAATILHTRLLPQLSSWSVTGSPVDVFDMFAAATMDFVTCYQFGLSAGTNFLSDEVLRRDFLRRYRSRRAHVFWPGELPTLTAWLGKVGIRLVPRWVDEANRWIERWALDMCDRAAELTGTDTGGAVFPQLMCALGQDDGSKSPTPGAPQERRLTVASEMLDHLAAGFETSSITLTYLAWELSRRPCAQARLRQELKALMPPSSGSLPDPKELDRLPYMHAVVQETLRLHAAIPGPQPRVTPFPAGAELGGEDEGRGRASSSSSSSSFTIPPNVRVSASAHVLHRNPEVFPDPETWLPERWLEGEGEGERERNRWFWAFGSGGRMCVGSNLAIYRKPTPSSFPLLSSPLLFFPLFSSPFLSFPFPSRNRTPSNQQLFLPRHRGFSRSVTFFAGGPGQTGGRTDEQVSRRRRRRRRESGPFHFFPPSRERS